eukprot:5450585-Amphidinium_carterae.1
MLKIPRKVPQNGGKTTKNGRRPFLKKILYFRCFSSSLRMQAPGAAAAFAVRETLVLTRRLGVDMAVWPFKV